MTVPGELDLVVVVTGVGGFDLPDPDFIIHEYIIKAVTDQVCPCKAGNISSMNNVLRRDNLLKNDI